MSGHKNEVDPDGLSASAPGAKLDRGKDDWSLLDWDAIEGVVRTLTHGKEKYSEDGWKQVSRAKQRYLSAMMRHLRKMQLGEYEDPTAPKGINHYDEFLTNAMFLAYFYRLDHDDDDYAANNENKKDAGSAKETGKPDPSRTSQAIKDALSGYRNGSRYREDLGA